MEPGGRSARRGPPTTSSVEDIRVSEQHARLLFVDPLACVLQPSSGRCPHAEHGREKRGISLRLQFIALRT